MNENSNWENVIVNVITYKVKMYHSLDFLELR